MGGVAVEHTLACDSSMRLRKRRVLNAVASGRRMVYRLRTGLGREILATAEHPLLTVEGWRPLAALQPGDAVAAARELLAGRGKGRVRHRLHWDRVASVEAVGVRETYDLAIEGDHNFLANGLVVHNSHAASFALIAYASAYLKTHHSAAFYAALLNNQPMGFYHPATIVRDAQRRGQGIQPIDVNRSGWLCHIEADGAVRLGLRYAKGLREEIGKRIEAERGGRAFASVTDLVSRTGVNREEVNRLAEIGAFESLGRERRAALWEAARAIRPRGSLYESLPDPPSPSPLPPMTAGEGVVADYEGTSLSLGPHPMSFHRARLAGMGVRRSVDLAELAPGQRLRVAGAVVVRQRPGTAKGLLFMNLEDETGLFNIVVYPDLFRRQRELLVTEPFLLVDGVLQREDNVTSVLARRVQPLRHGLTGVPSHDFH
jgi:error-prone DNA polymerase